MQGIGVILLYVVIIGAFYFIAIRPQKKREKGSWLYALRQRVE